MISLDAKTQTSTSSSPLSTAPAEEGDTPSLSFSELLKGAGNKKDENSVQNGVLLLALDDDADSSKLSKGEMLLSLLKGGKAKEEKVNKDELSVLELNPAITKDMTPTELKALVSDAKKYLKTKIIESEGFKKSEIEALPKTLKGLAEVAKKFGLDLSKLTLEDVKVESKVALTTQLKVEGKEQKSDAKDIKISVVNEDANLDTKTTAKKIEHLSLDEDAYLNTKTTSKKAKMASTSHNIVQDREDSRQIENLKTQERVQELPKEIKSTPLFKAQTKSEITTEQLVNAKMSTTTEVRTPKQKADDTLKMLLRGEKVTQKDIGFTADFSVATARVIAPQATTDANKSLESLLRGDQSDSSISSKLDGLNINKADSFEVKLNEAKQMTKYLSADVKTAIEDYKSPFTRVKVQLNPQKLGEVDLTIVQRGKNLHINLTSNNAAINALALNANDLKVQLTNNGINNASLNFNNNSQSSEQSFSGQQQQQNSQNEREASREYNFFENEEQNEEIINSLEIVVPNYA